MLGETCDACPRERVLLTAPPKRPQPGRDHVMPEGTQPPGVSGHRVIREVPLHHLT